MTEEERREMTRSNYAAQMEMLGYDPSGNPLDDVVRVVRCKNCKKRLVYKSFGCPLYLIDPPDDWYCADGIRR